MTNKKQDILKLGHFKRKGQQGSFGHYFTYTDKEGYEVCLESCLNGYDVAIYKVKNLICKKECTNIENMLETQIAPGFSMGTGEAIEKALRIANKKYKELKNDK